MYWYLGKQSDINRKIEFSFSGLDSSLCSFKPKIMTFVKLICRRHLVQPPLKVVFNENKRSLKIILATLTFLNASQRFMCTCPSDLQQVREMKGMTFLANAIALYIHRYVV